MALPRSKSDRRSNGRGPTVVEVGRSAGEVGSPPLSPTRQRGAECLPRWRVGLMDHGLLSFRELEALASPFSAIFLALFHPSVARQVAGVAQFLAHTAHRIFFGSLGRQSEHCFE